MSTFTLQKLSDSNKKVFIKLTGTFTDSNNEINASRIQANTLNGALDINNDILVSTGTAKPFYDLSIFRIVYFGNITTRLFYGSNDIIYLTNSGEYNLNGGEVRINNMSDIGIQTINASANSAYTLFLEIHKNNDNYDAGQYSDPAAFNFGQYGVSSTGEEMIELFTDSDESLINDSNSQILNR
jgi:hypothetical protein